MKVIQGGRGATWTLSVEEKKEIATLLHDVARAFEAPGERVKIPAALVARVGKLQMKIIAATVSSVMP